MPYITKDLREKYRSIIRILDSNLIDLLATTGELNFLITMVCKSYLEKKGESYSTYNDIIGVLECVKHELYDKRIRLYENKKEQQNGTIW